MAAAAAGGGPEEEAAAAAAGGGGVGTPQLLIPGQVIQNYEIQKPLGKGKFSVVYMAKRLSDEMMCALKKINIFDMMVPKQRDKCMKEVRLLQSLDHPNIVKLLDSFVDSSELLIIVEWAEKGDLKRLIRKAVQNEINFKQQEIWEYARQLSSALDHMHKKRIMHRDLKPANIFVAKDNSLKLGDLGLGRFFSSHTLEAFSKVGTPLYMSPEVLKGAGYDMRSDVWSLGCVVYELCVLRSPFKSEQQLSLYDLFIRINKGQYPALPEKISAEFRELVTHMLQLDPGKRADSSQVLEVCTAHVRAAGAATSATPGGSRTASKDSQAVAGTPATDSQHLLPPRQRPSPLLVMDDIVEKLKLLECEELCFRKAGFPMLILHRCFFAEPLPLAQQGKISQFEVLCELMRWLLAMLKDRAEKASAQQQQQQVVSAMAAAADASAGPCLSQGRTSAAAAGATAAAAASGSSMGSKPMGSVAPSTVGAGDAAAGGPPRPPLKRIERPPEEARAAVVELIQELRQHGIQISTEEATLKQLQQGFGEDVCLVLNELINQELVARDFHFAAPDWASRAALDQKEWDEAVEESIEIAGGADGQEEPLTMGRSEHEAIAAGRTEDGDGGHDRDSDEEECRADARDEHNADGLRFKQMGSDALSGGGHANFALEPIHSPSRLDLEAWNEEVRRAAPLLKSSRRLEAESDWREGLFRVKQITKELDLDQTSGSLPRGLEMYSKRLREELSYMRGKEDQLNSSVIAAEQLAELASLRDQCVAKTETIAALQARISELSQQQADLTKEVDEQKVSIEERSEAVQESDALRQLRQACLKLRNEGAALAVKSGLLEAELTNRQRTPSR